MNEALAKIERNRKGNGAWSDSEDGEWQGIQEPEPIDHEDEYLDEDRHTVVTVEAIDASREGLRRIANGNDTDSESEDEESEGGDEGTGNAPPRPSPGADEKSEKKYPRKKKTNFRYESKAERKVKKSKERAGKRFKSKDKNPRKP